MDTVLLSEESVFIRDFFVSSHHDMCSSTRHSGLHAGLPILSGHPRLSSLVRCQGERNLADTPTHRRNYENRLTFHERNSNYVPAVCGSTVAQSQVSPLSTPDGGNHRRGEARIVVMYLLLSRFLHPRHSRVKGGTSACWYRLPHETAARYDGLSVRNFNVQGCLVSWSVVRCFSAVPGRRNIQFANDQQTTPTACVSR